MSIAEKEASFVPSSSASSHGRVSVRQVVGHRPLRGFEVVMCQIGDSMGPDLIVGAVHGAVDQALLVEACFRVQQRHPTLRSAIRWPAGRLERPELQAFEADKEALDVSVVDSSPVQGSNDRPLWQWVVEQQTAHRFDLERGFLLRVVWVPLPNAAGGHLIICSHHAIVDGTSLMRILSQTMTALDEIAVERRERGGTAAQAAARLPGIVPMPMPSPIFDHMRFSLLEKLLSRIGVLFAAWEQKTFVHTPWLPPATSVASGQPFSVRTLCIFREGAASNWQELHRKVKASDVTVGGLFSAAIQYSVGRYLTRRGVALPKRGRHIAIPLSMDFNMRERIDVGAISTSAIGLGTSIGSVGVKVTSSVAFWDLALQLMASSRKLVKTKLPKVFQGLTDKVFDYPAFLVRHGIDHHATGGAGDGVNISNVGRYPFTTQLNEFRLESIFGLNGACISGPMFVFWLRHINGKLCYNAIACHPGADRQMLEELFEGIVELMEGVVAHTDPADVPNFGDYCCT